ncbi:hypothetical protein Hanom_Chr07g00601161 [Helianthus anomalus]
MRLSFFYQLLLTVRFHRLISCRFVAFFGTITYLHMFQSCWILRIECCFDGYDDSFVVGDCLYFRIGSMVLDVCVLMCIPFGIRLVRVAVQPSETVYPLWLGM